MKKSYVTTLNDEVPLEIEAFCLTDFEAFDMLSYSGQKMPRSIDKEITVKWSLSI